MFDVLINVVAPVVAVAVIGGFAGRRLGFDLRTLQRASLAISSAVPNQGNMGLPMVTLAFGTAGLEVGTLLFAVGVVLNATLAVSLGTMALARTTSVRALLVAPLRYPTFYAAVAGALVNVFDVRLPTAFDESIGLLAEASIPVMLVILGMSVQRPAIDDVVASVAGTVNRLLLAPLVALIACLLVGVDGVTRNVVVVMSGMPAAVNTTILAGVLGADVALSTSIVVVSTGASIATLTALITLL